MKVCRYNYIVLFCFVLFLFFFICTYSSVNMGESEWEKEKPKLLKMIQEKQDQLNDFEKVSSVI